MVQTEKDLPLAEHPPVRELEHSHWVAAKESPGVELPVIGSPLVEYVVLRCLSVCFPDPHTLSTMNQRPPLSKGKLPHTFP